MTDLLALFDGNSLGHRAYHALPPLWSFQGEPNHAVHGFASMLMRALQDLRPTHAAVAFDTPTPTFRHLAFPEYKAQRGPAPSDLYPQFGRIRQAATALGLACLECPGYEADDVLATLAHQASESGFDVVVVTGDTDALQVVTPRIRVLMPVKGFSETLLFDRALVRERYGVDPEQFAALKALRGDPSDNIGGLPGIGPKTATRLIGEHGSIDGILAAAEQLSPALRATVVEHAELARRNHALTTVRRDTPVAWEPTACCVRSYDRAAAAARLRSIGLARLLDRLPRYDDPPPTKPGPMPTRARRAPADNPLQPSLFG